MNEKYMPRTPEGRLVHLVEECSEVIKEICKAQRFGLDGDPDWRASGQLPPRTRIINELTDLKKAIELVENDLS